MEKDTLLVVMMEITLMAMDAAEIVMLKLDTHVMVVHQAQKTAALLFFLQPFQLNQEANQDSMEKLFSTLDLTIFQRPFFHQPMTADKIATVF